MFFGLMLFPGMPAFLIAKALGASIGWSAAVYWIVVIVAWLLWKAIQNAESQGY